MSNSTNQLVAVRDRKIWSGVAGLKEIIVAPLVFMAVKEEVPSVFGGNIGFSCERKCVVQSC